MRRGPLLLAVLALACGCAPRRDVELPPVGRAGRLSFIVEESRAGPIVLIFPGRSAPTDDVTLGIRQTALRIAGKTAGSTAIFRWTVTASARAWGRREAEKRRAAGGRARLALVGHSWGGQAAGDFAREALGEGLVDEVPLLVTIDAIKKGYVKNALCLLPSVLSLELVFPHRLKWAAHRGTPEPDGKKLLRHVNYYQLDSPHLCGAPIETATENHEVWLGTGREPGHGNLDNLISELVAEDVRRAFVAGSKK